MAASKKHVLSDDENIPLQPQKASKKMLDVDAPTSGELPFMVFCSLHLTSYCV
jgi:hypothetical protein